MLNAHYDTVGVDGMPEPFSAAIRDGKLYGRGAYDMKGSLGGVHDGGEGAGRQWGAGGGKSWWWRRWRMRNTAASGRRR